LRWLGRYRNHGLALGQCEGAAQCWRRQTKRGAGYDRYRCRSHGWTVHALCKCRVGIERDESEQTGDRIKPKHC